MDRPSFQKLVYKQLACDESFRRFMTAVAPDGTRPIVTSLSTDFMSEVLNEIRAVGGQGNVVAPWLNGMIVFSVAFGDDCPTPPPVLRDDCTVGVFLARLHMDLAHKEDPSQSYQFASEASAGSKADTGHAELVGVAS